MSAPVTVVSDLDAAERWVAELDPGTWRRRPFDELPGSPWDLTDRFWVVVARPTDEHAAANAVMAVLRGVAAAIVSPDDVALAEVLADDLRRVAGDPADGVGTPASDKVNAPARPGISGTTAGAPLHPDAVVLLTVLAEGGSMAEAAATAHISLRTAERRISAARRLLGVRTTAEAVIAVFDTPA